jgi:hypothetical protein
MKVKIWVKGLNMVFFAFCILMFFFLSQFVFLDVF